MGVSFSRNAQRHRQTDRQTKYDITMPIADSATWSIYDRLEITNLARN